VDKRICVEPIHASEADLVGYECSPVYDAPYCLNFKNPESDDSNEYDSGEEWKAEEIGAYARGIRYRDFDGGGLAIEACRRVGWHCQDAGDVVFWGVVVGRCAPFGMRPIWSLVLSIFRGT